MDSGEAKMGSGKRVATERVEDTHPDFFIIGID
jgi:hypothetical protein